VESTLSGLTSARLRALVPHSRRDLRLASGLVLFGYVAVHLSCHALGVVSRTVAEAALHATVLFWHSIPGTVLLYAAAAVHISLALLAVYERRTLRMAPMQAIRIALGLAMPIGLIGHFIATRYAFDRFGLPAEYARIVPNLWAKNASGLALGLLAPGWIHGCLGLRLAFGHRRAWQRLRPLLFGAALLVPVLAALGFVNMGRELAAAAAGRPPATASIEPGQEARLGETREGAELVYVALVLAVALGRLGRSAMERGRKSVVWIAYPGRTVSVPRGWSVLDASRSFGIPHSALCGGRARCTTCRVVVLGGQSHCPEPGIDERRALDRIARPGSDLRLACQLRPTGDIRVAPVLSAAPQGARATAPALRATDHDAVLLLFDVRIDAPLAPSVSGHDALYALGRFLAVAEAIADEAGAEIYKHAASSWIVALRSDADLSLAVARALFVAARIDRDAASVAATLAREMGLRTGHSLLLHVGRIVVGTIGSGTRTVLGRPVVELEEMRTSTAGREAPFMISAQAIAAGKLPERDLAGGEAAPAASDTPQAMRWRPGSLPAMTEQR
jgi:adenylate cyclase